MKVSGYSIHSATKHGRDQGDPDVEPLDVWDAPDGSCHAEVHDLSLGLPACMDVCDLLYAEPPWRRGWDLFHAKAGVVPRQTWGAFMTQVGDALLLAGRPAILLCGREGFEYLPQVTPHALSLYNNEGYALCLGGAYLPTGRERSTFDLLAELADRYACVGDPCCGYGVAGRFFRAKGKRAVLTDVNPHCIGVIAAEYADWTHP